MLRAADFVRASFFNSGDHDFVTNGERYVLERALATTGASAGGGVVVFDVGANVGDWSQMVLDVAPAAVVHAFEAVPETREVLRRAVAGRPAIEVPDTALGNSSEPLKIHHYANAPTGSSAYRLPWGVKDTVIEVPCMIGDNYRESASVSHIDYLKIDAEGSDYAVLEGFAHTLAAQKVGVIQFEYNRSAALSKNLLGDYVSLLAAWGYEVGRLLPGGVDFSPYNLFRDENFLQANFIACREQHRAALAAR